MSKHDNDVQESGSDLSTPKTATEWLLLAVKKIPAFKFAFGAIGLVAVACIATGLSFGSWQFALYGAIAALTGMILIRVYAVIKPKSAIVDVSAPVKVLIWTAVLAFVILVAGGLARLLLNLFSEGRPPARTVDFGLHFQGQLVSKKFSLAFQDETGTRHATSGNKGEAQLQLPGRIHLITNLSVTVPCFKRIGEEPIEIVDGKPIIIQLERVVTPRSAPLLPTAFPDPRAIIPSTDRPTAEQIKQSPKVSDPGTVVLEYKNQTDEFINLLLYSFDSSRANNPWRVLPSDPCVDQQTFNGFTEGTGWFAIIARKLNGSMTFLRCLNVYEKERTELTIELRDSKLLSTIR